MNSYLAFLTSQLTNFRVAADTAPAELVSEPVRIAVLERCDRALLSLPPAIREELASTLRRLASEAINPRNPWSDRRLALASLLEHGAGTASTTEIGLHLSHALLEVIALVELADEDIVDSEAFEAQVESMVHAIDGELGKADRLRFISDARSMAERTENGDVRKLIEDLIQDPDDDLGP